MNKLLVSLLIVPVIAHGMAIKDKHFLLPEKLDGAKVYYDNDGFSVVKNNHTYNVPSYEVAKHLRHRSKEELKAYLKTGFLELKRMSDENYKIDGSQRGIAGGPFTGMIFGVVTAVGGCVGTLAATVASIPAVGFGCIFVGAAGASATVKATLVATAVGTALPTP